MKSLIPGQRRTTCLRPIPRSLRSERLAICPSPRNAPLPLQDPLLLQRRKACHVSHASLASNCAGRSLTGSRDSPHADADTSCFARLDATSKTTVCPCIVTATHRLSHLPDPHSNPPASGELPSPPDRIDNNDDRPVYFMRLPVSGQRRTARRSGQAASGGGLANVPTEHLKCPGRGGCRGPCTAGLWQRSRIAKTRRGGSRKG